MINHMLCKLILSHLKQEMEQIEDKLYYANSKFQASEFDYVYERWYQKITKYAHQWSVQRDAIRNINLILQEK